MVVWLNNNHGAVEDSSDKVDAGNWLMELREESKGWQQLFQRKMILGQHNWRVDFGLDQLAVPVERINWLCNDYFILFTSQVNEECVFSWASPTSMEEEYKNRQGTE